MPGRLTRPFSIWRLAPALAVVGSALCSVLPTRARPRRGRTAELAASLARQRDYFNNSPVAAAVLRVSPGGELIYEDMNVLYTQIYGCSRQNTVGRSVREVWPELDISQITRHLLALASSHERSCYTVTREVAGTSRVFDVDLAPLLEVPGEDPRILVCIRDVTEQRELERKVVLQAELQAQAAEREMALFQNSSDILFVVHVEAVAGDLAFTYESFSPSLENATGWRAADLIGRGPNQTLPPANAEIVLATYRRCVEARQTIGYVTTYETPLGRREYDGSLTPVQHPTTGETVRLVGALRDVTERNVMQQTLHHAQKMEAVGRLSAGVAHDFNNILQNVCGNLELAMDTIGSDSAAHELLSSALRAARRGASLTGHLLSYSKRKLLRPQVVALGSLLSEIEKLLLSTLGANINIQVRVDGATPPVRADPAELETAILNLAINASHAMRQGGKLSIEAHEIIEGGRRWAEIAVTDNGVGMDAATLAQATEPFFTTKGLDGTGLGLSMAHGFAEQSGGRIQITSELGHGTSVVLVLPAGDASFAADEAIVFAPPPTSISPSILVVDDDADVLATVCAFLRSEGCHVTQTSSGDRALAMLASGEPFDAIVSDVAMPGLSGMDLIAEARLMRPSLPAVLVTGYAAVNEADMREDTILLRKPVSREKLVESVRRLVADAAGAACEVPTWEQ